MEKNKDIKGRLGQLLERFHSGCCTMEELSEIQVLLEEETSSDMIRTQMMAELDRGDFTKNNVFKGDQLFEKLNDQIQGNTVQQPKVKKIRRIYFNRSLVAALLFIAFVFGGLVTYFFDRGNKESMVTQSYCEVSAPLGAITEVTLPDGSTVWLNAGSRLKYSTRFNVDNRDVALEGEGYFKVAKNKELPFFVNAYGFEVEALGAEFNVKAYPEDTKIETFLVEGKVELGHVNAKIADETYLNRKFKATFYKNEDVARINGQPRLTISPNNDPVLYTSWKENKFASRAIYLCYNN